MSKIVFVLTQSLDSPSGLGRYGPLAKELARLNHEVEVIALHYAWDRLQDKRTVVDGVPVFYAGQMHVRKEGSTKSYYGPIRLLSISLNSTFRLARALARSEADIVQLGKAQPYNILAARLGGRGRPVYCDCDDFEAETNRFSGRWQRLIVQYFEDRIVNHVKGLTVNTEFLRGRYVELGFPAEHIVYVPNGVDRQRFDRPLSPSALRGALGLEPGAPVIVYVGTLGLQSHPVDLLLQAFRELLETVSQARLLLVGGGEDFDRLQQEARQMGIGERTLFAGRVAPDQVPGYLALATVSVDPVHDDLTARARSPLKVVESIVMGVPVVTGDVGDRRMTLQ
ncbi:MAG: glycosyltransferase, partial [Candidatus Promineifilaceae bacterium]